MNWKTSLVLVALLQFANFYSFALDWPDILPTTGVVIFDEPANAKFDLTINDNNGQPKYKLSCRSGEIEDDSDFNYSGLFHCRMTSLYSNEYVSNLLVEHMDQSADWEGRGRFLLGHVSGGCALTHDWGSERHFKLRGMDIKLTINEIRLDLNDYGFDIKSFNFSYVFQSNKSVISSISQSSLIPEPTWFGSGGEDCVKEQIDRIKRESVG